MSKHHKDSPAKEHAFALGLLLDLAVECEQATNPEEIGERYTEGLARLEGAGYQIEEIDRRRYMRMLDAEAWESAAMIIAPVYDPKMHALFRETYTPESRVNLVVDVSKALADILPDVALILFEDEDKSKLGALEANGELLRVCEAALGQMKDAKFSPDTALALAGSNISDEAAYAAFRQVALAAIAQRPPEPLPEGETHRRQYYRLSMVTHGYKAGVYQHGPGCTIHHPLSSGGGPMVEAYAPVPGLAMLSAILKAYAQWPELLPKP